MAVLYEDSFVLLREASALMDQVLLQTADPNASGKIRAAFYKLYQAANSATSGRTRSCGRKRGVPPHRGIPVQALLSRGKVPRRRSEDGIRPLGSRSRTVRGRSGGEREALGGEAVEGKAMSVGRARRTGFSVRRYRKRWRWLWT